MLMMIDDGNGDDDGDSGDDDGVFRGVPGSLGVPRCSGVCREVAAQCSRCKHQ